MVASPNFIIPDYSMVATRGQQIAKGIQDAINIIGQTSVAAIDAYKQQRNVETAFKGIRGYIIENQQKYGLTDKQADAFADRLKFKPNEKVEDYEKRVAPTLLNMKVWEEYSKEPEFKIDLPNPFLDNQSFISVLNHKKKLRDERDLGEAVYSSVFGQRGTMQPTTEPEMANKLPMEDRTQETGGMAPAQTQEEATQRIAGRLPGKMIGEEQLQQFPSYRSLPSEAGIAKGQMAQQKFQTEQQQSEAKLGLTQAQTEAAKALTSQRNTMASLQQMKQSPDKMKAVNNLKDFASISRLEIAAREMLNNTLKDDGKGGISEDWLDMKELTDALKQKRSELSKGEQSVKPSMETTAETSKIEQEVNKMFPKGIRSEQDQIKQMQEIATRINTFALSNDVMINYNRIIEALRQGQKVDDIIERINKAKQMQQKPNVNQPLTGGDVGRR